MLINTSIGLAKKDSLDHFSAHAQFDFVELRNMRFVMPDGDKYECTEQIFMRSEANAADDRKNRE